MSSGTPDRWLNYQPAGKPIGNTPFVAFKCPLKEILLRNLPVESRFGADELKKLLPEVSLIIDLTNTEKYYSPKTFQDIGVEYEKIKVPGHYVPRNDLLERFFHIVDNFIQQNAASGENNLIGVHCTHGVNRTGFFICSYMINKLGFNFETAISEFNLARGHQIERQNYIAQLRKYEEHPLKFISEPGTEKEIRRTGRPRQRKKNADTINGVPDNRIPNEPKSREGDCNQFSRARGNRWELPTQGPSFSQNMQFNTNQYYDPRKGNHPISSGYAPPPLMSLSLYNNQGINRVNQLPNFETRNGYGWRRAKDQ